MVTVKKAACGAGVVCRLEKREEREAEESGVGGRGSVGAVSGVAKGGGNVWGNREERG